MDYSEVKVTFPAHVYSVQPAQPFRETILQPFDGLTTYMRDNRYNKDAAFHRLMEDVMDYVNEGRDMIISLTLPSVVSPGDDSLLAQVLVERDDLQRLYAQYERSLETSASSVLTKRGGHTGYIALPCRLINHWIDKALSVTGSIRIYYDRFSGCDGRSVVAVVKLDPALINANVSIKDLEIGDLDGDKPLRMYNSLIDACGAVDYVTSSRKRYERLESSDRADLYQIQLEMGVIIREMVVNIMDNNIPDGFRCSTPNL